jgi:hypothetical protein
MKKALLVALLAYILFSSFGVFALAHSGKTDSNGGHYDSSTGKYHYHHGHSAHQHYDMDGDGNRDCPYDFDSSSSGGSTNNVVDKESNEGTTENEKHISFGGVIKIIGLTILFSILLLFFIPQAAGCLLYVIYWILYLIFDLLIIGLLEIFLNKDFESVVDKISDKITELIEKIPNKIWLIIWILLSFSISMFISCNVVLN